MNSTPTRYTAGRDSALPSPPSGEPAAAAAQPGHPVVQLRPHSSVGKKQSREKPNRESQKKKSKKNKHNAELQRADPGTQVMV